MKKKLPVINNAPVDDSFLDTIDIATPCSADWNQMSGDSRVRHCSDCRLNVYNLSEMTRKEAAALIVMNEGKTCVRLYRRPDGTLLTQDCWARLRAARQRGWVAFAAALVIVCITQLGLRFAGLNWLMKWYGERPTVSTPVDVPVEKPTSMMPIMGEAPPVATPKPIPRPTPLMGAPRPMPPKTSNVEMGGPRPIKMGKMVRPTEL